MSEGKKTLFIACSMIAIILLLFFAVSKIPVTKAPGKDPNKFDSQDWKENKPYYRESSAYDLIDRHILEGKTHDQVKEILGPSDPPEKESMWGYDIPSNTASFSHLLVRFKNGKVKNCEVYTNP